MVLYDRFSHLTLTSGSINGNVLICPNLQVKAEILKSFIHCFFRVSYTKEIQKNLVSQTNEDGSAV